MASRNYWICTTRLDGRPHAKPVWGAWIDDRALWSTGDQSVDRAQPGRQPGRGRARGERRRDRDPRGDVRVRARRGLIARFVEVYADKYDIRLELAEIYGLRPDTCLAWTEADYPEHGHALGVLSALEREGPGQDDHQRRELRHARHRGAERDRGQRQHTRGRAPAPRADAQRGAEDDVAGQERGQAAGQEQRLGQADGLAGVADHGLQRRGDGDDPQQHEPVAVAERVDGQHRAIDRVGGVHRALGPGVVAAEVRPPQLRAQRQPEQRHADEAEVDGQALRADADGHDRLADGDDDDEAVALDEVAGGDGEAGVVDHLGGHPPRRRRSPRARTAPCRRRSRPPARARP